MPEHVKVDDVKEVSSTIADADAAIQLSLIKGLMANDDFKVLGKSKKASMASSILENALNSKDNNGKVDFQQSADVVLAVVEMISDPSAKGTSTEVKKAMGRVLDSMTNAIHIQNETVDDSAVNSVLNIAETILTSTDMAEDEEYAVLILALLDQIGESFSETLQMGEETSFKVGSLEKTLGKFSATDKKKIANLEIPPSSNSGRRLASNGCDVLSVDVTEWGGAHPHKHISPSASHPTRQDIISSTIDHNTVTDIRSIACGEASNGIHNEPILIDLDLPAQANLERACTALVDKVWDLSYCTIVALSSRIKCRCVRGLTFAGFYLNSSQVGGGNQKPPGWVDNGQDPGVSGTFSLLSVVLSAAFFRL